MNQKDTRQIFRSRRESKRKAGGNSGSKRISEGLEEPDGHDPDDIKSLAGKGTDDGI
jgi:hypothetical protein